MSAITDILGQLPLGQLAEQLGVSETETKTASTSVITSLLGGLTANAQEKDGEASLAGALTKHASKGAANAKSGVKLGDIDVADGKKIVEHALGTSTTTSAEALAAKTGNDQSLIQKLLPTLAPVVLGYVANQALSGKSDKAGQADKDDSSSGGLGAVIGGLLGGSSASGLGSMLGGLLGGALNNQDQAKKAQQSSGGVLGGLLDAIF
ncbi:MAG: DUF937 domain-containing protein [Propionibacteriaceae bacterium]|jgi:hypothetical protein|nr:DUF937 domain-containing protein [Propionibacteriaceae bacterium]